MRENPAASNEEKFQETSAAYLKNLTSLPYVRPASASSPQFLFPSPFAIQEKAHKRKQKEKKRKEYVYP